MILAIAFLLVQAPALAVPMGAGTRTPANDLPEGGTSAAAAANVPANPVLANLPIQRESSSVITPIFPAPVTDDSSKQKSAPAQTSNAEPKGAPAAPANLPAAEPVAAHMPGQLEAAAVGESSSREAFAAQPATEPAAAGFRAAQPYRPTEGAGRLHGLPRKWLLLSAAEHGAATFDAWSTRRIISNGTGYEMDPMLKPFANSGALYGAVQLAPVAFDFLSLRMMRSQHNWVRRMWWLPQGLSTGASFFAGVHNLGIH